jgi:hypothetical protein
LVLAFGPEADPTTILEVKLRSTRRLPAARFGDLSTHCLNFSCLFYGNQPKTQAVNYRRRRLTASFPYGYGDRFDALKHHANEGHLPAVLLEARIDASTSCRPHRQPDCRV